MFDNKALSCSFAEAYAANLRSSLTAARESGCELTAENGQLGLRVEKAEEALTAAREEIAQQEETEKAMIESNNENYKRAEAAESALAAAQDRIVALEAALGSRKYQLDKAGDTILRLIKKELDDQSTGEPEPATPKEKLAASIPNFRCDLCGALVAESWRKQHIHEYHTKSAPKP